MHDAAVLQPQLPLEPPTRSAAQDIETSSEHATQFSVAGLFAGIGGIEAGLHHDGHTTRFLCESEPAAAAVLEARFPSAELWSDVRDLPALPSVDVVTAGFPCQDLSIAGKAAGIGGKRSGLVEHIFRLLDGMDRPPRWLLMENVPFMLRLDGGKAMSVLVGELEARGYRWAYRVVDTRAFGLPQRRQRILMLASQTEDPRPALLGVDFGGAADVPASADRPAFGFYWTEGHRGIAWSADCVPPIKVGSGLGIPSPPAIWMPDGSIVMPDIRDAERLQGFEKGWTEPAGAAVKQSARWKLLGNAVSVPVAEWIGRRLSVTAGYDHSGDWQLSSGARWPTAAWGCDGSRHEVTASMWPVSRRAPHLHDFLEFPGKPLSQRGAAGLLKRLTTYGTRVPDDFLAALRDVASGAANLQVEPKAA